MLDPELLERITARRAELDERLAKQLAEVRTERDELAVAERVLERVSEQLAGERASATPMPGQVGGQAVMLIPHRTSGVEEATLPPDYQRILAAVRQAAGPVMAREVGEVGGGRHREGQAGTATQQAGQTRRSRLAAETARRPVHHPPGTSNTATRSGSARA
ncbi:hypothetical protein [Streptomyces agglomeratus]|uniref:hypothetical protein n=1 Tax=Streptomyces agglomeratus TaxID=285458 RepID=UPI000A49ED6A|nr:hypothetical protein [Streptomyces agglomeratus]